MTTPQPDKGRPKEVTIVSLSEDIHCRLEDIRALLDAKFGTTKQEIKPEPPARENVLDIIIDTLTDSIDGVENITAILTGVVLPKIS